MKIRKFAAVGVAVAALSALALPISPAAAQVEPAIVVEKLVLGETDTTEFQFTVECETLLGLDGPDAGPASISDPFVLSDGQSEDIPQSMLSTSFAEGVDCQVVETALGTPPPDAWVLIFTDQGDLIESTPGEVPMGADFAWDFTTLDEYVEYYNVVVVNDYSADGTASDLCAVIEEQVGQLANLIDSFGDIETLTPEQLTQLWEALINLFIAGAEVAPLEIAGPWENVAVAYIEVGHILSSVDFDVDALTEEQIAQIEAILDTVGGDVLAIAEFLSTACAPPPPTSTTTSTTAQRAAVTTAPRYAG